MGRVELADAAVDDPARVGFASPNVTELCFAELGNGVGVSTNFTVSSVSVREVLGGAAGSGCGAVVGVATRTAGGCGVAARAADGCGVDVRGAPGDDVGVATREVPGADVVLDRVAAGVLVPASGTVVPEYEVGDAVLVRDANGEVVVRLPDSGGVALRATDGDVGDRFDGGWL